MGPLEMETFERQQKENQKEHHLQALRDDKDRLFVRRGQSFRLLVKFRERGFCPKRDAIDLALETGPSPAEKHGTLLRQSMACRGQQTVAGSCGKLWYSLEACTPAWAPIGRYEAFLETRLVDDQSTVRRFPLGVIVVLFNAWCKDDAVYLEDDALRSEYLLNQSGQIYMGSQDYIQSKPWNFSQFTQGMADICIKILDVSNPALKDLSADVKKRGDPVYISRVISAMINSNDDKGVLQGNWSDDYSRGVRPSYWTGSADILRRWFKEGCQPVKYGQCWVFAAVACSVLRFLGVPTRCVTNFQSAHDTDGNLSCDHFYYKSTGKTEGSKDSVWNFHVWVESWMSRKDLCQGYDGWQVVDPTPQERSEGVFCCGPAPVKAVRSGEVSTGYETPFVFAEVNADMILWSVGVDGQRERMRCNTARVGKCISTKRAGSNEREDITLQYKYQEGSPEERAAYARALSIIGAGKPGPAGVVPRPTIDPVPRQLPEQLAQGLLLRTRVSSSAFVGSDVDVHTSVRNPSREHGVAVTVALCARPVTYSGVAGDVCAHREATVEVPPGDVVMESLRIKFKNYASQLLDHNIIRVTCSITLPGLEPILAFCERNIILETPQINLKVLGEPIVGRQLKVEMSLENPLPQPLLDGSFSIEGPCLTSLQEVNCSAAVEPKGTACASASFCPSKSGVHHLVATFCSNRLRDVRGETHVIVRKA